MSKAKPIISVIIPTYHDWDRLEVCINSLNNQTLSKKIYEIIIVNNDPEDSPPDENSYLGINLISERKSGSYAARNTGIKFAKGNILAFTDSDCIPYEDWLENIYRLMSNNPKLSRVGGKVELFYSSNTLSLGELYEKAFAFPQKAYVNKGT